MPRKKSDDSADVAPKRMTLAAAQSRINELENLLAQTQPADTQSGLDRYHDTLDSLLESCQIISFDWRYLYLNDVAVEASHLTREVMIGHTLMETYPGIETTEMFAVMRKCMEERVAQDAEFDFTYPDKSQASFEFRIQPVPEGIFILTLNITERKRANANIRKLNRTLSVLSDINQAIVRTRDMSKLVEQACNIAVEKGTFRIAWIALRDPQTKGMTLAAYSGIAAESVQPLKWVIENAPPDQGLMNSVMRSGERVVSNDFEKDPRVAPMVQVMLLLNCHAAVALPLTVAGEVRGVFQLFAQEADFFDAEELKLVDEMAMDISFAMDFAEQESHRQQAQDAVRRYNQRLQILREIDREIIAASSIQTLLAVIVKHMRQLIPCPRVTAALFDRQTHESVIFAIDVNSPTALGEGLRTYLPPTWFEGFGPSHVRVIDDFRQLSDPLPNYKLLINEGLVSSLQVLLTDRNDPIGVFGLSSDVPGFFTVEHQEIASEVGNQLAIAIQQIRLSEAVSQRAAELESNNADLRRAEARLQRYAQRMEVFHEIDIKLIQGRSIQELIQVTLQHLRQLIPCQQANVILIDRTTGETGEGLIYVVDYTKESVFKEGVRFPLPPDAFDGYDARNLKVFDDIRLEPETNLRAKRLASEGLISGLSVFLMDHDVPVAALSLLASAPAFFNADYQDIALEIANQLAIAIRQVNLSNELELRVLDRTAELNDAKRRVEAILNSSADAVILVYLNTGIQQTNDTFNQLFSCSADDYFGKHLTDLVSPEDQPSLTKVIQSVVVERQGKTFEVRARRFDDTRFDAEISISPMSASGRGGLGYVCNIRDITERKVQERQLRFHASLQQNVSDAVIATDLQLNIQTWNQAAERIYGWRPEEVIGKSIAILQSTLPENQTAATAQRELLEKGHWTAEVVHRDRNGKPIDILSSVVVFRDDNGAPLGIVGVNHDITERKRLTKELEEQRTFLREVIDVSPNMIFVKDYDARFVLVNPVVANLYNRSADELIGKTDADFNPNAKEVADFLEADRKVIETGVPLFVEEPVTNADGETHWLQTIKVPIISVDGKTKYVLGVATDVTERKHSEEMLREAFQKEKELGELKSRFVSMASHEFRTPLATILAVTETLSAYRHKLDETVIEQRLEKIREQVSHLKDVIDDVLQLAQIQARRIVFNPVRVDLDAMCRSVLDEFQSRPNIKHELVYTCDDGLHDAHLDKRLMRQIISNLMSNAVKYSPDGKIIRINLEKLDNKMVFKIQDQGIGIPESDLKHLFEPFHRADNVGTISGTGLGLVITKESVELHGGSISVESQVNVGTTFTVQIPLDAGSASDNP